MKPYLLDTNVVIALAWPNHVCYHEAQSWFAEKGSRGFRTCPLTQTGFVRISSNPAFTSQAVTPAEALALLEQVVKLAGHEFWPDDIPLHAAIARAPALIGHRQITDAYLLALASKHNGVLATFDLGLRSLARADCGAVEIIGHFQRRI